MSGYYNSWREVKEYMGIRYRSLRVSQGYITLRLEPDSPFIDMAASNGYVFEHRVVMAKHLGRLLRLDEVVHHKNGDRMDNRVENLAVMSAEEHAKLRI